MRSEHPRPRSDAWRWLQDWPGLRDPVGAVYERSGVRVISTRVVAVYPSGVGEGLQDHVSISRRLHRPPESDVRRALAAFGVVGAEEDNHHPGIARHFWRPVDPAHYALCQCKETETVIVDSDGYTWTNPKDEPCRGCSYVLEIWFLRGVVSCPLHGEVPGARDRWLHSR